MPQSNMSFGLAWRFFRGGEKGGLVSLISAVSTVGMTIAVALLIVVLSVMNGFDREFRTRILGLSPHADIRLDEPLPDWEAKVTALQQELGVVTAYPYNGFEAMIMSGRDVVPLMVQGMLLNERWEQLGPFIDSGMGGAASSFSEALPNGMGSRSVIIGAALAKKLALDVGDTFKLLKVDPGPDRSANRASYGRTRPVALTVVGVLRTGTQIDNYLGIMSLMAAGELAGNGSAIQGIQLQFDDVFRARERAYRLAQQYALNGRLSDWTRDYGNLYLAIQLSRQLVVMLVATIVAIAVFNVFVTLGMVVRHKYREIAILRTLGLLRKTVMRTFLWQGIFIALPGCAIGVALGVVLAYLLPNSVALVQQLAGIELLNTEIYPINYLPSQVRISDILLIVFVALVMSLLATLGPAWKASTMQPVRVLNRDQ